MPHILIINEFILHFCPSVDLENQHHGAEENTDFSDS